MRSDPNCAAQYLRVCWDNVSFLYFVMITSAFWCGLATPSHEAQRHLLFGWSYKLKCVLKLAFSCVLRSWNIITLLFLCVCMIKCQVSAVSTNMYLVTGMYLRSYYLLVSAMTYKSIHLFPLILRVSADIIIRYEPVSSGRYEVSVEVFTWLWNYSVNEILKFSYCSYSTQMRRSSIIM